MKHVSNKRESKSVYYQGLLFNVVSGELVVSSPDKITSERLEAEATLLDSVERETECEAVRERVDTYEVIIDNVGERTPGRYVIGGWVHVKMQKELRMLKGHLLIQKIG